MCSAEVNSAEDRNWGKVPFLLGTTAAVQRRDAFLGASWLAAAGQLVCEAGTRLALPAPLWSFPGGVSGLRRGLTCLILFTTTKGESRSEG